MEKLTDDVIMDFYPLSYNTCSQHTINILHLIFFPTVLNTDQISHIFSLSVYDRIRTEIRFGGGGKRMVRHHQATKGLQHKTGEQAFRGPLPNSAADRG